jgi:hypothetical protein
LTLRGWLGELALYRLFKRSELAMWLAVRLSPGGESLWPGLDTALKNRPEADDAQRLTLAEAIIAELAAEAHAAGAAVVLLHIPYLAQVYDDAWDASFGGVPDRYDRDLASKRLAAIADRNGLLFVDAFPAMRDHARRTGRWLHHRLDGHPTKEGQEIIAEEVARVVADLVGTGAERAEARPVEGQMPRSGLPGVGLTALGSTAVPPDEHCTVRDRQQRPHQPGGAYVRGQP